MSLFFNIGARKYTCVLTHREIMLISGLIKPISTSISLHTMFLALGIYFILLWEFNLVVRYLPTMSKALGLIPSTPAEK
jgi:hypothetical protein